MINITNRNHNGKCVSWWVAVVVSASTSVITSAFTLLPLSSTGSNTFHPIHRTSVTTCSLSLSSVALLTIELEKPLGMILEEFEEGMPKGVKVEELSDAGSAYASEYRDQLVGLRLATVMGEDVTQIGFDDVMDKIIDAPSPVTIQFEGSDVATSSADAASAAPEYDVGTAVAITVMQEGKDTLVISDARVGDNLRKTLLANNVELYRGLKKKLGNCGGGGQCLHCAIDLSEADAWSVEQSDYEESRIGKFGSTARLACMNNIMGPATIRVQ